MGYIIGLIFVIAIIKIIADKISIQRQSERMKNMPPPKRDAQGNISDSRYDIPDTPYEPPKSKYRPPDRSW